MMYVSAEGERERGRVFLAAAAAAVSVSTCLAGHVSFADDPMPCCSFA